MSYLSFVRKSYKGSKHYWYITQHNTEIDVKVEVVDILKIQYDFVVQVFRVLVLLLDW